VKGYQIAKGEYVLFDKDELDAVKLESTRIIDSDLLYDQERMLHHEIEDLTPV
jgi:non-homologous end joining protein Ku